MRHALFYHHHLLVELGDSSVNDSVLTGAEGGNNNSYNSKPI